MTTTALSVPAVDLEFGDVIAIPGAERTVRVAVEEVSRPFSAIGGHRARQVSGIDADSHEVLATVDVPEGGMVTLVELSRTEHAALLDALDARAARAHRRNGEGLYPCSSHATACLCGHPDA